MSALLAWLWQGAAIAVATAALLGCMRRLNAASRHAIWWFALAAVFGAPLVRAALVATAGPESAAATGSLPDGVLLLPAPPDSLIALAIGAWLGTLIVGFVNLASGLRSVARLKAGSSAFDRRREARLPIWQSTIGGRRRPELRVSDGAQAACALGLRRPVILLSQQLLDGLDDDALDQVVMHEYAHLLRYDDWLRLIETIVVSIAGLHPAVRFIARRIDLEREAACDDVVVSRTGGARAYAACLADAAAIAACGNAGARSPLAPGATGATVSLRARVMRLLDPRRVRSARLAPAAIGVGLLTLASTIAVSHHVAPVLVVDGGSGVTPPPVMPAKHVQEAATAPAAWLLPPASPVASARANAARPAAQRARASRPEPPMPPQLTPSEVVSRLSEPAGDVAPAPLASSSIAPGVHTPVPAATGAIPNAGPAVGREAGVKWSSLGAPGVAIGRGAKSIAGFFGGAAKAVATSF